MLTQEQKNLVKSTIPTLKENNILLTSDFYKRMIQGNPELKHIFNMGNQQNGRQHVALANAVIMLAEHIENPSVLMSVGKHIGEKHTSLNIRPEYYQVVGKHLIASIGMVLGSAATEELMDAWKTAYGQLAYMMIGVEQEMYKNQISKNGGWTGWKPFTVFKKEKESEEITSFYLKPTDGGPVADFLPGQYISLRLFLPQLQLLQPRQYSVSCAPNGAYYRISVKKEAGAQHPDGMISNYLHQSVAEGQQIELTAPSGSFTLQEPEQKDQVFISGGVGQTPLLSMLEQLLNIKTGRKITWIHGCKNESVHAFRNRLSELCTEHSNITPYFFYDQKDTDQVHIREGWVTLDALNTDILKQDTHYYICGPGDFIRKHYDFLIGQGIEQSAIHFEEFGPASLQLN